MSLRNSLHGTLMFDVTYLLYHQISRKSSQWWHRLFPTAAPFGETDGSEASIGFQRLVLRNRLQSHRRKSASWWEIFLRFTVSTRWGQTLVKYPIRYPLIYPIEPKDVLLNVFITCIFWNLSEGHKGPKYWVSQAWPPQRSTALKKKGPVGYPHRNEFPRDFINCHPSFPSEMSIFFGQMSPVDESCSEWMLLQQTTSGGFLK